MHEKRWCEQFISQSTNQIRPSEIPRSTNYSVSTSPDPPLRVFFTQFFYASRGSGHETTYRIARSSISMVVSVASVDLPLALWEINIYYML